MVDNLNKEQRQSPVWKVLKKHIEERIESLRKENDSLSRDHTNTTAIRGGIKELKILLALEEDPIPTDGSE